MVLIINIAAQFKYITVQESGWSSIRSNAECLYKEAVYLPPSPYPGLRMQHISLYTSWESLLHTDLVAYKAYMVDSLLLMLVQLWYVP